VPPSRSEQANQNLDEARAMRAAGLSYREIARKLSLTGNQLNRIRRVLKRAKASSTRLRKRSPGATERDLPIAQTDLPAGLRQALQRAGYLTLGDLADRIADPDFAGLGTVPSIGPHRAGLVKRLLDHHGLLPGSDDMQAEIEALFPELRDDSA
jgi:hypothetical protein